MPPDVAVDAYSAPARWLHWVSAALLFTGVALAWIMLDQPRGAPLRGVLFGLHKSVGVTLLLLALARLGWRRRHAPPPLPPMPRPLAFAARATHGLLYALLLILPLSGYIHSATGGHPVLFFGLFDLPLLPTNETLSRAMLALHHAARWPLYALVALHVLGAAWHALVLRDDTVARMVAPSWPRAPIAHTAPTNDAQGEHVA